MKTKIKRHSRSVISVLLSVCMLISCMTVGLIATDAAKIDADSTVGDYYGYDKIYVKGSFDMTGSTWNEHEITTTAYTKTLSVGVYNFSFLAQKTGTSTKEEFSGNVTFSSTSNYNFQKQNGSITLNANVEGEYKFEFTGMSSGPSMSVKVTFPSAPEGPATWTVAGDNTNLFGVGWADNATANDLTKEGETNTYSKTYTNVLLNKGSILYKIVKNHSWNAASYPTENASVTVPTTGYYDVNVTFDADTHTPSMTLTGPKKYQLSVASGLANATVSAKVSTSTIDEGGSIAEVLPGAKVTVTAEPDAGKRVTGITVKYNDVTDNNTEKDVTVSGSGKTYTFEMPLGATRVTAVETEDYTVDTKTVYFYNKNTQYPKVGIYVYHKSGGTVSDVVYPVGTLMTKMDNSDVWYIDNVPVDAYIQFNGDGYSTGELQPLNQPHGSKYIPGSNRTTPGTGGYWGEYIERNNIYEVSKGSTLTGSGATNLFTGINATFFDYYVDNEVEGGWITGINDDTDFNGNPSGSGGKNDPYRKYLNKALSEYADNTSDTFFPANNISNPLYWGNNKDGNAVSGVSLFGFVKRPNNSDGLNPNTTAIQGLAGNTLSGGTIHHYKSDATNKNGPAMAFFDEDFLSGENTTNKALATILHSNSFPVRNETLKTVYFVPTNTPSDNVYAHFWGNGDAEVLGTKNGNTYIFAVPDGMTNVLFYHSTNPGISDSNKYNTGDLTIPTSGGTQYDQQSSKWVNSSFTKTTHTYYEYDSTGGKDNAFIQNINTTDHTADLNYYAGSSNSALAKSDAHGEGFFPFDNNNLWGGTYTPDKIYLKPGVWDTSSPDEDFYALFMDKSVNPNVTQWSSKMTLDSATGYYVCDVPDARFNGTTNKQILFVRMKKGAAPAFDDNKYNQTSDLTMPTTKSVVCEITGWGNNDNKWISDSKINVPYTPSATNNFAETGRTAHDQGFGMKLEIPFTLNKNGLNEDGTAQTFDFSGDDDLWVFIDDNLVLDLGGAHARTTGSINFNTMIATANTASTPTATGNGTVSTNDFSNIIKTNADDFKPDQMHTMTIYYMERGMFDSNLKFGFSFHAIPNQFQAEKKVRANNVNSGFFYTNGQAASEKTNMSDLYIDKGTRQVTWFEKSYQNDVFQIHQKFSGNHDTIKYTFGDTLVTMTSPDDISDKTIMYNLLNNNDGDRILYFNGQFAKEEVFEVWETIDESANNRYNYEPRAVIRDEAKSGDAMKFTQVDTLPATADAGKGLVAGDNSSHYKFYFLPKDALVEGGLEDIRIRARFENEIKTHNLTIKKNTNIPDTSNEDFTIEVMFKFGNEGYRAYPLYTDNDAKPQLDGTGRVTLKAGESITLNGIPETAEVRIREVYNSGSGYTYKDVIVTNEDGSTLETADASDATADGVTFTMGTDNATAEVNNTSGEPVYISHTKLPSSPGSGNFYVTAYVRGQNDDSTVTPIATYPMTAGVITVGTDYIQKGTTNKLEIVLKTVPGSGYTFKQFYEGITATIEPLIATGATVEYTSSVNSDTLEATVTLPINKLFDTRGKQLYTELPFYSELESMYSVTITKDIPNDDSLGILENLHTYFPVKIQVSEDGTNFTNYNDPALTGIDANGDAISEIPRTNYKDSEGNWFAVHKIRQKDRVILPNLKAGWKVKVIELKAEDISEEGSTGNRAHFVEEFEGALDNYTFGSITAKETGADSNAAANAAGQQYATVTVPANDNMIVTITNNAILYTVKVKKELKNDFPDDGSLFELTVSYNPTGSGTSGTYQPVTDGIVSDEISGGKTGANGVYTVKKNSIITFSNIPKGTFFKVQETSIGSSPVTSSERFILDSMTLSSGSTPTVVDGARFFSVTGNDTTYELTLTVVNMVKMSWTQITKVVDPVEDADSTDHKIKISVDYNGDNSTLDTIHYRTSKEAATATAVSASDTINIQMGGHVWLYYPIGSTISVEEVQPGENNFQIKSIAVQNAATNSIEYSKTDESLPVNNKVTFKTNDNADAVVTITNEKIPNIKYVITYTFPSRSNVIGDNVGTPKYGNLSYTVEGSGNPKDILADGKIKKSLVQEKVPYEKNFMQDMNWKFDNISYPAENEPTTDTDGVKVYHCTVSAVNADLPTVNVVFYFPYESKEYTIRDYDNNVESNTERGRIFGPDGAPTSLTEYTTQTYENQVYQSNPVVYATRIRNVPDGNGGTTEVEYQEKFSTFAAESVGGKKFAYWSIRSKDRNDSGTTDKPNYVEVARCYEAKFNYTLFDNYRVYAMYEGQDGVDTADKSTAAYTTINFLEYSRNQWNKGANGKAGYPNYTNGDAVWTDFDVAFENGTELLSTGSTEVGVLVERVQDNLDDDFLLDPSKSSYADNYNHYVDKYNQESGDEQYIKEKWMKSASDYILGTDLKQNARTTNDQRVKTVLNSSLTNKNRMEFGFALFVNDGSTAYEAKKNGLYRAYSYMKVKDGGSYKVILCDTPVYFCVKAEANKNSSNVGTSN